MDLTVEKREGHVSENRLVAVPSDRGGVFLVDHGDGFGYTSQVYVRVDLGRIGNSIAAEVESGDTSLVEDWLNTDPDKPGVYKIAHGIGSVAMIMPKRGDKVEAYVKEFMELSPRPKQSVSRNLASSDPAMVDYQIPGNDDGVDVIL